MESNLLSGRLMIYVKGIEMGLMEIVLIVIGLAAVIIGQVLRQSILGQKVNFVVKMLFVVVGAVIYYVVITFVLWLGLPSENMKMFSAIVVAVFLAVPYLRAKAKSSFRRGGSK